MTAEEHQLREEKHRHIRRLKRWLRPLPRRATVHRYPVVSMFSRQVKGRGYLWDFRVEAAVPAIYAGCILTLLPLYGLQIVLAVLFALLLRANLPILVGLQLVSNPLTVWPIWYAAYQVGRNVLAVLGVSAPQRGLNEVKSMLYSFTHGDWGERIETLSGVFVVTSLGALVMGIFFGLLGSFIYRAAAARMSKSYAVLVQKIHEHRERHSKPPFRSDESP